jgi:predicted transcriptional regulator
MEPPLKRNPKSASPILPEINDYVAHCLAKWLHSREEMQRTPHATAKVLSLAVKLDQAKQPWPTRQAVADHLHVSRPMVDVVLSQRRGTKHLKVRIVTKKGNVARRVSVIQERYVKPSADIIKVVLDAEQAERDAKLEAYSVSRK